MAPSPFKASIDLLLSIFVNSFRLWCCVRLVFFIWQQISTMTTVTTKIRRVIATTPIIDKTRAAVERPVSSVDFGADVGAAVPHRVVLGELVIVTTETVTEDGIAALN